MGSEADLTAPNLNSALHPKADSNRTSRLVRNVSDSEVALLLNSLIESTERERHIAGIGAFTTLLSPAPPPQTPVLLCPLDPYQWEARGQY